MAGEQRVHGAVERRYRLRQDRAVIDADAAAAMTLEDHRRGFAAAMAVLIAEFNAYLDRDGADRGASSQRKTLTAPRPRLMTACRAARYQCLLTAEFAFDGDAA